MRGSSCDTSLWKRTKKTPLCTNARNYPNPFNFKFLPIFLRTCPDYMTVFHVQNPFLDHVQFNKSKMMAKSQFELASPRLIFLRSRWKCNFSLKGLYWRDVNVDLYKLRLKMWNEVKIAVSMPWKWRWKSIKFFWSRLAELQTVLTFPQIACVSN